MTSKLKSKKFANGNMPQMGPAISNWQSPITMTVVTQVFNKGFKEDRETSVMFKGVIQPLKAEQLQFKPTELRSLRWLQIHTFTQVDVKTRDIIEFNGVKYRVMGIYDYSLDNYIEYHAVEAFQDGEETC